MNTSETTTKPKRIVYVVFHGLISIVKSAGAFRAYILSMGNEHHYRYGNWLRESDIPQGFSGEFRVGEGPGERKGKLDPAKRPTVDLTKCQPDEKHPAIHARIEFPQPDEIKYAAPGDIKLGAGTSDLLDATVSKTAGTLIFVYNVLDFDECFLMSNSGSVKWSAESVTTVENVQTAALHLFSNPARDGSPTHSFEEFHLSAQILGAKALRLAKRAVDSKEPELPPDGLCVEELYSLSLRDAILDRIVRKQRGEVFLEAVGGGGCESCCSGSDGGC